MNQFKTVAGMQAWSSEQQRAGRSIGFVPTMGFLHDGHLSLVDLAKQEADAVVVSIFVNPTQFGPNEDFDAYPRDLERDLAFLEERGVEAVYLPTNASMYPEGYATYVDVERLGDHLCGASRPIHFRGVTTVVTKLFHAVRPDVAVFGQKDAQQARIIERMTRDLDFGVRILTGPIAREEDGLAMSSRNVRLSPEHRAQAPAIQRGLRAAAERFGAGERSSAALIDAVLEVVRRDAPDGVVDYVQLVDWDELQPIERIEGPSLLAAAVKFGEVRLIDNQRLDP